MAALHARAISMFVFTHDSIGLGEDGPTHQPIEHLAALRLIPNMDVWRPCDTVESLVAWARGRSSAPTVRRVWYSAARICRSSRASADAEQDIARGGYVLVEPEQAPRAVIIATGSEVGLAVEAQKALARDGIPVRVVSMPSTTVFDRQERELSRSHPAADAAVCRGRSRRAGSLAQVRRSIRRGDRHRSLRRVRAGGGSVASFRLRTRTCRRGGHDRASNRSSP